MGKKLFIYGFPGPIGGADTKLDHSLAIFKELFDEVMCIANAPSMFEDRKVFIQKMDKMGIKWGMKEDMKGYKDGDIALSLCNPYFFNQGFCDDAKSKGLKVVWSSEMMWHHEKEHEYVGKGYVDKVLYVSEIQKAALQYPQFIPSAITGNYIDPDEFPFQRRSYNGLSIGRLSRDDSYKYPENFPIFYEEMVQGLPSNRIAFRVMAWNKDLENKYKFHKFRNGWNWKFYEKGAMSALNFLYLLDIFAYPLGHNFVESWGRSTVEAMLTGAIPISFPGHHIDNLIEHGVSGYIASDISEWKEIVHELFYDVRKKNKLAKDCSEYAREVHCNFDEHVEIWKKALYE